MRKSELRQIVKEEYSKILKESAPGFEEAYYKFKTLSQNLRMTKLNAKDLDLMISLINVIKSHTKN